MWWGVAGAAGVCVLAVVGLGAAVAGARHDLERGNRSARAAIDLLADGQFDEAQAQFQRAASSFAAADSAFGRPWTQPARLVPVVAQHRNSAVRLVEDASSVSSKVSSLLNSVNFDSLRVVNGRIDVAAIEALEAPLLELNAAIDDLDRTLVSVDSPWLVDALRSRLVDLRDDIDRQQRRGADALLTVQQAPEMLGNDRPRVYFIAFTTPVEARGLGGFMGNWAEVTITDGKIEMTGFGRTGDLNRGGLAEKHLTGPEEFLRNYGEALLVPDTENVATGGVWSRITASPQFPDVAQAIAELYPQSGGKQLDGVFAMDVEAVAKLMEITGPVTTELGVELSARNAVDYLLRQQYLLDDNAERIDVLEEVARTTVTRLLTSELPSPPDLADLLGPMADQGRLVAWAANPAEEAVYEAIEMAGEMPAPTVDGLAVTFNNGVGNKIDLFLQADAVYSVKPDPSTGLASASLTLTLTNDAPAEGLPEGVIGNELGIPWGTNSTYLSVYSVLPFSSVTVDGEPGGLSSGTEAGYELAAGYVDIPAGQTVVVQMEFEGPLATDDGYSLVLRSPPTARPMSTIVMLDDVLMTAKPVTEPGVIRLP